MRKDKFEVGQTVWFEPSDKRDKGYKVTIIKVGRLFYTVIRDNGSWELKFPKDTLCRCEYPCGDLYKSEQEAKDYKKADSMLLKIRNKYYLKPTLEQMKKVYEILELKQDD
jgi:hypothetical protein